MTAWQTKRTRIKAPLGFIEPCRPILAPHAPAGPGWLHEIKWNGYRIIGRKDGERVWLWSRSRRDWAPAFPAIVTALANLPVDSAVIDGEAVALANSGVPHFHALGSRLGRRVAVMHIFDLLLCEGNDLRRLPIEQRRARLAALLNPLPAGLLLSEAIEGDGPTVFEHACALGLEGIVSKRLGSRYKCGVSDDWRKIKCRGYRRPA